MTVWTIAETFGGDRSYESPVLTFDGVATIYLNPDDSEGAAITLRIAADLRDATSLHLTVAEARELAQWLTEAVADVEAAA